MQVDAYNYTGFRSHLAIKKLGSEGMYGSYEFKMLPVTELMNIPDATFVKSTQSSATTEQT